uniref:Aromatic amino acid beta-eliminating lyase/threonine aldolase domain-containing protein n=1 Tax=Phytophthora ramorum TaxID=164328 RepID=H3GFB3_PHYRM
MPLRCGGARNEAASRSPCNLCSGPSECVVASVHSSGLRQREVPHVAHFQIHQFELTTTMTKLQRAVINFMSDTITCPTPGMRKAIAAAKVGDDVYGLDPTVKQLQKVAASMLGKQDAMFVPSVEWLEKEMAVTPQNMKQYDTQMNWADVTDK